MLVCIQAHFLICGPSSWWITAAWDMHGMVCIITIMNDLQKWKRDEYGK